MNEITYTAKLFGVTANGTKEDLHMHLQDATLSGLISQCNNFGSVYGDKYESFELVQVMCKTPFGNITSANINCKK